MLLTFSNIFSQTKSHMAPPWDGAMKVCSTGPGHMARMAAMPVYMVKTLKKIFSGTERPMTLKHGIQQQVFKY